MPTLGWLRVLLALLVMQFYYGFEDALLTRLFHHHPEWERHLYSIGSGNMGHYTYAVYLMHQFLGSILITLIAAYWIGVRFEGGVIARARKWAESATQRALEKNKAVMSMTINPWLATLVFGIAAANLTFLFLSVPRWN